MGEFKVSLLDSGKPLIACTFPPLISFVKTKQRYVCPCLCICAYVFQGRCSRSINSLANTTNGLGAFSYTGVETSARRPQGKGREFIWGTCAKGKTLQRYFIKISSLLNYLLCHLGSSSVLKFVCSERYPPSIPFRPPVKVTAKTSGVVFDASLFKKSVL